jgi:hypothetical protein
MNYLIPYVHMIYHEDPLFSEFTYGDWKTRAKTLLRNLKENDYVFFHTSINNIKYITAYYVVSKVLKTKDAAKNSNITSKYKNPHLQEYLEGGRRKYPDVIIFGDPISSRILEKPLPFNKSIAKRLSLKIKFNKSFTETQCIGSATRSWRMLTNKDIKALLSAIKLNDKHTHKSEKLLSTIEVTDFIEKDIEKYLKDHISKLGQNIKLINTQYETPVGRIDMLFKQGNNNLIVVELKLNKIGRETIRQIRRYMDYMKKETKGSVSGIVVGEGIHPAFEEELSNLKNIKVLNYGWKLEVAPANKSS